MARRRFHRQHLSKINPPFDRAFEITEGASVRISNLVITGSNPDDYVQLRGGGLVNSGDLALSRVIFVGNQAFDGGGLFNFGTLVAEDTAFIGNRAPGSAFINQGSASFRRSLIAFGINTGAAVVTGSGTLDRASTPSFAGAQTRLENVTFFKNQHDMQVLTRDQKANRSHSRHDSRLCLGSATTNRNDKGTIWRHDPSTQFSPAQRCHNLLCCHL